MTDEESFNAYVRARTAALTRVAYLLTGDHHLSEDLVQQTLIVVAARWERILAGGDPDPYVRKVLYRQHLSWRRTHRAVHLLATPPDRPAADPSADVPGAVVIRQALARLAPKQRAALVLRFFEDLTELETAEVLRCSVSTVKSHVRAAISRLRLADLGQGARRMEVSWTPDQ